MIFSVSRTVAGWQPRVHYRDKMGDDYEQQLGPVFKSEAEAHKSLDFWADCAERRAILQRDFTRRVKATRAKLKAARDGHPFRVYGEVDGARMIDMVFKTIEEAHNEAIDFNDNIAHGWVAVYDRTGKAIIEVTGGHKKTIEAV